MVSWYAVSFVSAVAMDGSSLMNTKKRVLKSPRLPMKSDQSQKVET